MLWSYAQTQSDIAESWELGELLFKRTPIDQIYKQLADSDMVGFSTYLWNKNYNYQLAKKIKEYNPRCQIVLGGPEPALEKDDIFQQLPFVDVIVRQEGEKIFADLLRSKSLEQSMTIPGLVLNVGGRRVDTGVAPRIDVLDCIPSPYLTGMFDQILKDNPGVSWNASLETNRGCPYQCTFCDWGGLTYSKVKKFDLNRVCQEIEWIGKNRIGFVSVADANFGMFVERDESIIDHIISVQNRYEGYPTFLNFTWAKNQKNHVVKLVKKLYAANKNTALLLSLQSLDETTLTHIKRRNLEIDKVEEIFDLCAREKVHVLTEMILGLPGETLQSWQDSIFRLMSINQHNGIVFHLAQMLENAEMNLKQREEFSIETKFVNYQTSGQEPGDDIKEFIEIITGTKDMPAADFKKALEFVWEINTWHMSGISQWHSRLLHKLHGISYREFYDGLRVFMSECNWFDQERNEFNYHVDRCLDNDPDFTTPLGQLMCLNYLSLLARSNTSVKKNLHQYHQSVQKYVKVAYGHLLDEGLLHDLNLLAESYVVDFCNMKAFPFAKTFEYNIEGFLDRGEALEQKIRTTFDIYSSDKEQLSISQIFFFMYAGRRRNFGKATINSLPDLELN
jgi:tRNA A37 methylthiotransferase MiaB